MTVSKYWMSCVCSFPTAGRGFARKWLGNSNSKDDVRKGMIRRSNQMKVKEGNKERKRVKGNSNEVHIKVHYKEHLREDRWTHSCRSHRLEHKMLGMGRPGTSPKSESFACNWFDRLLPVTLYSEPVSSQWHSSSVKPHHTGQAACKASCSLLSSCVISAPTGPMPFLPAPHTHPIAEPVAGNFCAQVSSLPTTGGRRKIRAHAAAQGTDGK